MRKWLLVGLIGSLGFGVLLWSLKEEGIKQAPDGTFVKDGVTYVPFAVFADTPALRGKPVKPDKK